MHDDRKYLAAYLLAALANPSPSGEDITKILSSVGIEADAARVKKLIADMSGKDINKVGIPS